MSKTKKDQRRFYSDNDFSRKEKRTNKVRKDKNFKNYLKSADVSNIIRSLDP